MDPAMYYQKNPVPWNLKKKKRGGIPINLYEGPIQCPDNIPYFNVYKVECDLRNNTTAQELQNPYGPNGPDNKTPLDTRQYVVNRNFERFKTRKPPLSPRRPLGLHPPLGTGSELDELKKELNQLPTYKNDEECDAGCSDREDLEEDPANSDEEDIAFWWDDPCVLVDKDYIFDIIPDPEMPLNKLLNSIVRFSVILFFLVYLITQEISMLYLVVAAFLATWYIHEYHSDGFESMIAKKPKKEKFIGLPSDVPGGVGTSNNPLDYRVLNTPAEFDDRLFKSNEENSGNYMMERNQVKSWDPFCPLSMTGGGFEHVLYGDNVKRHLFY